jgi:hypothetical protein
MYVNHTNVSKINFEIEILKMISKLEDYFPFYNNLTIRLFLFDSKIVQQVTLYLHAQN